MLRRQAACGLAAWLVLAVPVWAQYTQQGSKLVASGAAGSAAQGTSVAVSADGNTALVGGPEDNSGAGAVWVYTRANGVWTQSTKLVGSNSLGAAGQGHAVALSADGNTAAVGGINDNTGTGAVWVFFRSNGVWTQQAKLWGTVLLGISHQGLSVALSADGNTLVEGGDLDNNYTGAAWVFRRTNGAWNIVPVKLGGGVISTMSHQGTSVAISSDGNTIIEGGPGDNSGAGSAWVFTYSNGSWTQQTKLSGLGASFGAGFGSSVALSSDGNTAAVGAQNDGDNVGAVWVYSRANGLWNQQSNKLVGSDAASSRYLGASLALTGDGSTLLAGGPGGMPGFARPPAIGATWVFTRSNGNWSQQGGELVGSGTATNDSLQGASVAASGDGSVVFIGAPAESNSGAAWVFGRPPAPAPPTITTQPVSQTVATGQTATLTVAASGSAALSYQWYQGTAGNTSTPVGTNSASYTTPNLTVTTTYWVRVSNPYGIVDSNTVTITIPVPGPTITQVFNAASGIPTIAPNTWVAISGTNLAPAGDSRSWQGSDFTNNQLPTQLDLVTATVNGRSAYVSYISPTQVNVLTPPDAMQGTVQVIVTNAGVASPPFTAQAQAISPAWFLFGSSPYVAAEHVNGSYLGPATLYPNVTTPAKPGETIALFGNGFGATTVPVLSGSLIQGGTLPTPPVVRIGGNPVTIQYAGLISPGLYQLNVVLPATISDGDNPVSVTYGGVTTQSVVFVTVAH